MVIAHSGLHVSPQEVHIMVYREIIISNWLTVACSSVGSSLVGLSGDCTGGYLACLAPLTTATAAPRLRRSVWSRKTFLLG